MSTAATMELPRVQRPVLVLAVAAAVLLFVHLTDYGLRHAVLLPIGIGLGVSLYHAAFGFSAAYRCAVVERDISGIAAQLVMIAVAIVLFAPVLAQGSAFGRGIGGAVAPVSVSMALGAFVFGVGMQLAGGGNSRMVVVLAFFCLGGFWASLDLHWWSALPGIGAVSLPEAFGWEVALPGQLAVLALIYTALHLAGGRFRRTLGWEDGFSVRTLVREPWPLLLSAALLALGNWLTLLAAGHPWSITWALTLWPAKVAAALGWDPATSPFWSGGFPQAALARPVLADTVSVMNIGIVLGALAAASLAGKWAPTARIPAGSLVAAIIGGLMLGYGARLAYGCNIGAFFSGIASGSLRGWVWIAAAALGTVAGVRLRPLFRLAS